MVKYVCGLIYHRGKVLLLYKTKGPERLVGFWNGVGGKVEKNETLHEAIVRETFEETGIVTNENDWFLFAEVKKSDYQCTFFAIELDNNRKIELKPESEPLWFFERDNLPPRTMFNIRWFLMMLKDEDAKNTKILLEPS